MKQILKLMLITGLVTVMLWSSNTFSQDRDGTTKSRVVRASIFKNGLALLRQEITGIPDKDGWLRTANVAPPVLGTFHIISGGGADRVILEDFETTEPITSLLELFETNIGKTVLVAELDKDGQKTYRAEEIISVLKEEPKVQVQPAVPGMPAPQRIPMPQTTQLVVLQSDLATRIVPVNRFSEFMAQPGQQIITTRQKKQTRLAIHLTKPKSKETTVVLEYLTRGLRWIPAYRLVLTEENKVELALSAEVVNDIMDLDKTKVEFTGGFTHFLFTRQLSPLALTPAWPVFSQFITPPPPASTRYPSRGYNYPVNYSSSEWGGYYPQASYVTGSNQPATGVTIRETGEPHYYQVPELTLPKGKRGKFSLWQTTASYQDLYVLEINDAIEKRQLENMRRSGYYPPSGSLNNPNQKIGRVWQTLNLLNTGPEPWTAGPAVVFADDRPIGQDIISFTAPGTATPFYLTPAPQITYQYSEEIVSWEKNAHTWRHSNYSLVKGKGALKITNNKTEPVKLKLIFHRGGEITEVDYPEISFDVGSFVPEDWPMDYRNYYELNLHSKVTGTLTIQPGEGITVPIYWQYYERG